MIMRSRVFQSVHLGARVALAMLVGLAAFFGDRRAEAYQILPKVSDVDRELSWRGNRSWMETGSQLVMGIGVPLLKGPIHEAITLAALGCDVPAGEEGRCVTKANVLANRVVLYGVRWPDDPPFRLDAARSSTLKKCDVRVTVRSTAQPDCWMMLFTDAGRLAKQGGRNAPAFGPGTMLLYRSHYGDLQFMHSMAAFDGEPASQTRANMQTWAKYLWGIAIGATRTDVFIRDAQPEMASFFPGDMTSINLFATGIVEVRKRLPEVAFGALLHMVQDSFSRAHTTRREATGGSCPGLPGVDAPGRIEQFHGYAHQDGALHDEQDTEESLGLHTLQEAPSVVDVSRHLVTLWRKKASWDEVQPYIACVFDVVDGHTPAGPGPFKKA